ncbi:bifunctional indole-3-glycerol-phosphate synthase TrpC/phosphoribosylanthranilate isomerase TrpF, partial [Buchnera aphidicola (Hormaphis cornu)]
MQRNILKEIISYKINWIDRRKKIQPLASFRDKIKKTKRNFKKSLQKDRLSFILELKKASPSLGVIKKDFNIKKILKVYKKYATAISVLTDSQFFQGDFEFLSIVHAHTIQPILCKDFFIDPYQIYLARYYQADAILLILSILNDEEYLFLSKTAKSMNMHILTEINNNTELERAISLKAEIIGINNRNLKNFIIDINITKNLAYKIPKKIIIISESGISNYQTVKKLSKFVHGFLIGSALMKSSDLDLAVRRIIFGNNKICGLTLLEDVKVSKKAGAIYAGMIFAHQSPRKILLENAAKIIHTVPLRYVGVF